MEINLFTDKEKSEQMVFDLFGEPMTSSDPKQSTSKVTLDDMSSMESTTKDGQSGRSKFESPTKVSEKKVGLF